MSMKTFNLIRNVDISGVSGIGKIAEGVQFTDGVVVMRWLGRIHSLEMFDNAEALIMIHGHEGRTVIKWDV